MTTEVHYGFKNVHGVWQIIDCVRLRKAPLTRMRFSGDAEWCAKLAEQAAGEAPPHFAVWDREDNIAVSVGDKLQHFDPAPPDVLDTVIRGFVRVTLWGNCG